MYKVIIIEDDPMVASINKQYVEVNPLLKVVHHFSNGHEALAYLKDHTADLAIMDVYMPVMDGMDLLKEIRKTQKEIDVIMVTAANDSTHIQHFLHLGVIDYLIKPFEYKRFNHALQRFMEHRKRLSQEIFSQQQLDSLLDCPIGHTLEQEALSKGLQEKTLATILSYMKQHSGEPLTSEKIADQVGLSRVTVRRYMNYLVDKKQIISDIDYTTGGRPSIIYKHLRI
ncbi:CitB family two-component system response regulator MalR/two-component system response regulator DctR [Natranaerovirga hydrolytica]|uniref:Transcriptional regulatory protein n=1 Tax=Natranaerovirga hydrolytica TaxID=680378 RepID=A0A4R1MC82_9FIRM|nr:response regulator [Natranaerovirga hydrolytica]TCK89130.1 CitB family two-component system response regulator MalR/two-component system response regulator DctR [Natranaerovirga hydrolytica]